jgi:hypothetical protein
MLIPRTFLNRPGPIFKNLHFGLDWRRPSMQSQGVKKRLVMPPANW